MTKQDYGAKPHIMGVEIKDLKTFYSDDGSFMELGRFYGDDREDYQINLSVLNPGAIKAFHRHENQDDQWMAWEPLLVGLRDDRENSPTFQRTMRFVLCNQSLWIPRGVLHGVANLTGRPVQLFYWVNQHFNPKDPDEIREPWDSLGATFWEMTRG